MQQTSKLNGDHLIVTVEGRITEKDHDSFRGIIETMKGSAMKRLTFNLAGAEFIDSAGLGMLLLLHDAAAERKVEVILAHAQGQVERLITASKFGLLFTVTG